MQERLLPQARVLGCPLPVACCRFERSAGGREKGGEGKFPETEKLWLQARNRGHGWRLATANRQQVAGNRQPLVPVVVGFKRSSCRDTEVGRLFLGQFGQFHAKFREMETGDFLV